MVADDPPGLGMSVGILVGVDHNQQAAHVRSAGRRKLSFASRHRPADDDGSCGRHCCLVRRRRSRPRICGGHRVEAREGSWRTPGPLLVATVTIRSTRDQESRDASQTGPARRSRRGAAACVRVWRRTVGYPTATTGRDSCSTPKGRPIPHLQKADRRPPSVQWFSIRYDHRSVPHRTDRALLPEPTSPTGTRPRASGWSDGTNRYSVAFG